MEMVSPPPPEQSPPQPPTPKQLKLSPKSDAELDGEGVKQDSNLKPSERTKKYLKEQKEKQKASEVEKQKASKVEKKKASEAGEVETPKVKKHGLKKLQRLKALSLTPRPEKAKDGQPTKTQDQDGDDDKAEEAGKEKAIAKTYPSTKQDDEQARNAHKMYMRYWRSVNECNLHCIRICTSFISY